MVNRLIYKVSSLEGVGSNPDGEVLPVTAAAGSNMSYFEKKEKRDSSRVDVFSIIRLTTYTIIPRGMIV